MNDGDPAAPAGTTELFGERTSLIERYAEILRDRAVAYGLLGPREVLRLWERHILNSFALAGAIPNGVRVLDVGSGAGLPGIPLAIGRPDLSVTLVDSMLRRANFLIDVVRELGLEAQVDVRRARAEELDETFDVVTARAVAPLDRLARWCVPLMTDDGQVLALKGEKASEEREVAEPTLQSLGVRAELISLRPLPDFPTTTVVRMTRA